MVFVSALLAELRYFSREKLASSYRSHSWLGAELVASFSRAEEVTSCNDDAYLLSFVLEDLKKHLPRGSNAALNGIKVRRIGWTDGRRPSRSRYCPKAVVSATTNDGRVSVHTKNVPLRSRFSFMLEMASALT